MISVEKEWEIVEKVTIFAEGCPELRCTLNLKIRREHHGLPILGK